MLSIIVIVVIIVIVDLTLCRPTAIEIRQRVIAITETVTSPVTGAKRYLRGGNG